MCLLIKWLIEKSNPFVGDENKCTYNKHKYISKYECIYKYMVKVDFRSAVQMSMDDANKFRLITC